MGIVTERIFEELAMGALGRRTLLLALALLAVALMLSAPGGALAAPSTMASHRAIYDMTLISASQTSDIAELNGQMLIEVIDVCDGWTLEQRIALTITNYQGGEVNSYSSFTSWESKDGRRFRFEQKTQLDDVTVDELGGEAAMTPGGGGVAVLGKPQALNLELAPGTLFPSRHTELLLASAAAGETIVNRVVFDGTSADGANRISAFIAAPTTAPRLPGEAVAPRVWPVRLAFYSASSAAPQPDVEIGMLLQANGVARHLTLDYGNFSIDGRLDRLELLPAMEC